MRVIVPPKMLVEMFGVPESVAIPSKVGQETVFDCHGRRFYVKKLSQSTWMLTNPLNDPRARFGSSAADIGEDVARVLETGKLPRSTAPRWA